MSTNVLEPLVKLYKDIDKFLNDGGKLEIGLKDGMLYGTLTISDGMSLEIFDCDDLYDVLDGLRVKADEYLKANAKPQMNETYSIKCCDLDVTYNTEYMAFSHLYDHIHEKHEKLFEKLEERGKELANIRFKPFDSYWEDPKRDLFRRSWTIIALKEFVKNDYKFVE